MTRGYSLMADVVLALAEKPRTAHQLHADMGKQTGIGPLRRLLRRLVDGRVLRIVGWVGDRNAERVYAVGSEPSVAAPTKPRKNGTRPRPLRVPQTPATPMVFVDRFCAIWHALETPCTIAEICEEVDSSMCVIRPLVESLRLSKPKLVRIVGYELTRQRAVLYERGGKADARRPERMSEHESYTRAKERRAAPRSTCTVHSRFLRSESTGMFRQGGGW